MAQKDQSLYAHRGDVMNDNVRKIKEVSNEEQDHTLWELHEKVLECPVCLQHCIHPVRLPCQHIFCFLCVKGAANQSKRCALCRQEIPVDFLNNPSLLRKDDLLKDSSFEDGYSWFYEGRNGWWQYDERTSHELEDRFKRDIKVFDLLIAGFLYVIDLDNMLQIRRNDPTRRRRMKRDRKDIPKKGVAGLKIVETAARDGADGIESGDQIDSRNANVLAASRTHVNSLNVSNSTPSTPGHSGQNCPNNTPQSPSSEGSPREPSSPSHQELTLSLASMSLEPNQSPRAGDGSVMDVPQPGSPTSSSDSDWE